MAPTKQLYRFGPFRLYVPELFLSRADEAIQLTPKALQTLLALVRNQGKVVSKDQLLDEVWRGTFVEEGILSRNVYEIRKALGDMGLPNIYIETVPKRGYRFIPAVQLQTIDGTAKSLAVLPFRPIGMQPQDQYLGLGLADAVITRLSSLRALVLRPTSSVASFAGWEHDAVTAGRELGVANVLEGLLRKSGEQVRLTVQLVSIPGGESLWSTKLDQTAADVFKIEDSVAEQVSRALMLQISAGEHKLLKKRYSEVPEAYHAYLKARFCLQRPSLEGLHSAVGHYEYAVRKDPQFALAYAGLAKTYAALTIFGSARPNDVMPKAREFAETALRMEPALQEAREALAFVRWHYEFDWTDGETQIKKLLELFPNDSTIHLCYAMLLMEVGRYDEAVAEARKSVELDPTSPIVQASEGMTLCLARRYQQAIASCREALRLDPNCFRALWALGLAYEQQGKYAAAIRQFRKAVEATHNSPDALASLAHAYGVSGRRGDATSIMDDLQRASKSSYVSSALMALGYTGLGDAELAFEYFAKAVEEHSSYLCLTKADPRFDPLRHDPRFQELLARIGLAPAPATLRASDRA